MFLVSIQKERSIWVSYIRTTTIVEERSIVELYLFRYQDVFLLLICIYSGREMCFLHQNYYCYRREIFLLLICICCRRDIDTSFLHQNYYCCRREIDLGFLHTSRKRDRDVFLTSELLLSRKRDRDVFLVSIQKEISTRVSYTRTITVIEER